MVPVTFLSVPSLWGISSEFITGPPFHIKAITALSKNFIDAPNVQQFQSPFETTSDIFGLGRLNQNKVRLLTPIVKHQNNLESCFLFDRDEKFSGSMFRNISISTTDFLSTLNKYLFLKKDDCCILIQRKYHSNNVDDFNLKDLDPIPIPPWPPPCFLSIYRKRMMVDINSSTSDFDERQGILCYISSNNSKNTIVNKFHADPIDEELRIVTEFYCNSIKKNATDEDYKIAIVGSDGYGESSFVCYTYHTEIS